MDKSFFRKVRNFLNDDKSLLSNLVNILIAFVVIKYLFFPGLSLVLGTEYPLVAVVSESMQHDPTGDFDTWWDIHKDYYSDYGIDREDFLSFPQKNGFNVGDVLLIYGKKFEKIDKGDVIVFEGSLKYPIIHRVINVSNHSVQTKGDNNPRSINSMGVNEVYITKDRYLGKAALRIPYIGLIKIWTYELLGIDYK